MRQVGALPDHASLGAVDAAEEGADGGWPLARVARLRSAELLPDLRSRFGDLPGGRWPEPAESALLLPIARAGQVRPHGVLVMGLSPRLAFDETYRGFLT